MWDGTVPISHLGASSVIIKKNQAVPSQPQMCPMRDQLPVFTMGKGGSQISLKLQHFALNEISVKKGTVIKANQEGIRLQTFRLAVLVPRRVRFAAGGLKSLFR